MVMTETIYRFSYRLASSPILSAPTGTLVLLNSKPRALHHRRRCYGGFGGAERRCLPPHLQKRTVTKTSAAGWFSGFGSKKGKGALPEIVKAGDPILHDPAEEVSPEEIGSERIQKIIDDMVTAMRMAPGVGLAAPQIGVPLKIIVLEDTNEYISYAPKNQIKAQDRRPFDLLTGYCEPKA